MSYAHVSRLRPHTPHAMFATPVPTNTWDPKRSSGPTPDALLCVDAQEAVVKTCPHCGTEYEPTQLFCSKYGATLRQVHTNDSLIGTVLAERYEILAKLGQGGMGQVYLARHVRIGRKSAVKVLHPALVDTESIARFSREATNASTIDHPNVAA